MTRLTSDVTNIQNAVSTGMRPFGRSPVMLILQRAWHFPLIQHWRLYFRGTAGTCRVTHLHYCKCTSALFQMQFAIDRMNRTIQENLTAVRVVKAYVRGDYEIAKFEEANLNLKKNPKSIWHCRVKYACHAVCYVRNNTVTAVIRRLSDS